MAKRRDSLSVSLVLDLDAYEKGLAQARGQAGAQGKQIGDQLGKAVSRVALQFFALNKAIALAKQGMRAFAQTAERLEKQGSTDAGVVAFNNLKRAVEGLGESFVVAVLQNDTVRAALVTMTGAAERAANVVRGWRAGLEEAGRSATRVAAEVGAAFLKLAGTLLNPATAVEGLISGPTFAPTAPSRGALAAAEASGAAIRGREQVAAAAAKADAFIATTLAKQEELEGAFVARVRGTADAFASSWQSGFAALGDAFREFVAKAEFGFGSMRKSTVGAFGEFFDAVAFTAPLLEETFGRSAAAAKAFQVAQLAVVGAVAAVKAKESGAEALSSFAKKEYAEGVLHGLAATAYAAAAVTAGVAAGAVGGGGGGGGSAGDLGITEPERHRRERRNITIIIENAVGKEKFVREEIIPAINEAVDDDVVLRATHAMSADRTEGGRFTSSS